MKLKQISFLIIGLLIIALPACSSGNDEVDEFFEIINDSVENNSAEGGQTRPPKNVFKLEPYFPLTKGGGGLQGAAIYGNYLFHATSSNAIHIYDFKRQQYITMLKMSTMGHADTMCFGIQKVDEEDEFPVLYISGSQSNTAGKGGSIYVYRIIRTIDESGSEKWQGVLYQQIVTPDVAIIGSFPDVVIDQESKCMWIMGWLIKADFNHDDGSGCTNCFSKFFIPDIRDGKQDSKGVYQLTLKEEDRLSFFMIYNLHAITQGLCYYKGRIICPYGKPSVSYKGIDVVDVNKEKLIYNVDLKDSKIREAEAAVIYDDYLFILGQGDYVYSCFGLDL